MKFDFLRLQKNRAILFNCVRRVDGRPRGRPTRGFDLVAAGASVISSLCYFADLARL